MRRTFDRAGWAAAGAATIGLVLMVAGVVNAGPLDPPGAPTSTDSVRLPGTPISTLGTEINQPGHYYLTRNVTGNSSGTNGITINVSDVTIDLNGFTMAGVTDSGTGIFASGALSRITIRNGTVRNWGDFAGNGPGITLSPFVSDALIEHVIVEGNSGAGLAIGSDSIVQNVIAVSNDGDGINAASGNVIRNNVIASNDGVGIFANSSNVIRDNQVTSNGAEGIFALSSNVSPATAHRTIRLRPAIE